jgi:hypothetical protein
MIHVSRTVEVAAVIGSVAMFVITMAAIPLWLSRIDDEHFVRTPHHRFAKRIALNAIGALLVALGVAMLVLPGQGILTMIAGITLLDIPLKRRILRRLMLMPKVKIAIDGMRARVGRGPLIPPPVET